VETLSSTWESPDNVLDELPSDFAGEEASTVPEDDCEEEESLESVTFSDDRSLVPCTATPLAAFEPESEVPVVDMPESPFSGVVLLPETVPERVSDDEVLCVPELLLSDEPESPDPELLPELLISDEPESPDPELPPELPLSDEPESPDPELPPELLLSDEPESPDPELPPELPLSDSA
jgi:hypothetical protein